MSGRWKGEKQLQVQQRGRPMPFTEEQMRQIYNTNIIDFAVRNGFEIEKSDKATVHVKHNGGLYLFKHGRGYYSFTEERGGDIVEFAMNYLGLKKREAMEQILGCRAYERTAHVVSPQEKAERGTMVLPPRDTDDRRVFAYVQKELNVDIILIDTRAGFNQWGSLSLLTLSNQVIFIAYPNNENVEGLNMALQLMQNIGKKRYAVAMSKVVASEEGVKKTRSLFEGLNVAQEDLIPVYYKQEIALSNRYPIDSVDILVSYKELSDYILNNEKIERNKKLLMNGMKEQMLGQMFIEKQRLVRFLAVEQFLNQEANMFLKYRYREELFGIRNTQIKRRYKKGGMRMFQQLYIQL